MQKKSDSKEPTAVGVIVELLRGFAKARGMDLQEYLSELQEREAELFRPSRCIPYGVGFKVFRRDQFGSVGAVNVIFNFKTLTMPGGRVAGHAQLSAAIRGFLNSGGVSNAERFPLVKWLRFEVGNEVVAVEGELHEISEKSLIQAFDLALERLLEPVQKVMDFETLKRLTEGK